MRLSHDPSPREPQHERGGGAYEHRDDGASADPFDFQHRQSLRVSVMSKPCGGSIVNAHIFDVSQLWEIADWSPERRGVKAAIDRAARRLGFKRSRTYEIWYGRARRVEADEQARIAEALDRKRQEAARNELHDLRLRLARLEARLATTDEAFFGPEIAAARALGGTLGHRTARPQRP